MKIEKKMKKVLAFGTLFLLVFVLFIGLPMNAGAVPTTIYVDDVAGSGPGNPPEDYTSIQAAINAASPGDTIFIYAGTYAEKLTVTKALTLEGENRDTTIIQSPGGWYTIGIYAYFVSGITIENLNFQGFYFGIYMRYSSSVTITNNIVTNNNYGMYIMGCPSSTITGNTVTGPGDYGIRLSSSKLCTLKNNVIANYDYNFGVDSYYKVDYYQYIDSTNTVDGKPIYYLEGVSNVEFNSVNSYKDAGFIGVLDSDKVTIKDLAFSNNNHGILLVDTTNAVIQNVEVSDAYYGIFLYSSASATLTDNIVSDNYYGIYLKEAGSSTLTDNTATDNNNGIYVGYSDSSTVTDNTVTGNSQGIVLFHSASCTAADNTATGNLGGIQVNLSPSCIVTGNTANDNTDSGISVIDMSYYTTVTSNTLTGNKNGIYVRSWYITLSSNTITESTSYGIYMFYGDSSTLTGNTVTDCYQGIVFFNSPSCTMQNNAIAGCVYNFGVTGYTAISYPQNIDTTNTVNSKPIYYLSGLSNLEISPESTYKDAGYIGVLNSDHITIKDMSLSNNLHGILLVQTTDIVIQGVEVSNNQNGIYMISCGASIVTGSTAKNNDANGIYIYACGTSTMTDNTLTDNGYCGIYMYSGGSSLISGNTITNSANGIYIYFSNSNTVTMNTITGTSLGYGLYMTYSDTCTVKGNTILENRYGIFLMRSSSNSITCNKIADNMYGIYAYYMSNNNNIYHNNFIDNTIQVYSYYATNTWDNGYPSGGNYWNDYSGIDANNDGIGDTPYVISLSENDNYPLMTAWGPEDSVDELIEDIEAMELHIGLEESLVSKLEDVLDSIAEEEYKAASNQLEAFINQVEAQRDKKLTEEQVDQLIEAAEMAIFMISSWM
jgi:parallel beta-helix repeat protein